MRLPRPGITLLDDERHVAALGDAVDRLEMAQARRADLEVEAAITIIKFIRARLAERAAAERGGVR